MKIGLGLVSVLEGQTLRAEMGTGDAGTRTGSAAPLRAVLLGDVLLCAVALGAVSLGAATLSALRRLWSSLAAAAGAIYKREFRSFEIAHQISPLVLAAVKDTAPRLCGHKLFALTRCWKSLLQIDTKCVRKPKLALFVVLT